MHFVMNERQKANLGIRLPPFAHIKITKLQTESDVIAHQLKNKKDLFMNSVYLKRLHSVS